MTDLQGCAGSQFSLYFEDLKMFFFDMFIAQQADGDWRNIEQCCPQNTVQRCTTNVRIQLVFTPFNIKPRRSTRLWNIIAGQNFRQSNGTIRDTNNFRNIFGHIIVSTIPFLKVILCNFILYYINSTNLYNKIITILHSTHNELQMNVSARVCIFIF